MVLQLCERQCCKGVQTLAQKRAPKQNAVTGRHNMQASRNAVAP